MSILAFVILGLVAGWVASVIMGTDRAQGPILDIVLGIIGAFVGGYIFSMFGEGGTSGLNLYSVVVATIGAVVLIWLGRLLGSRV